MEVVDSTSGSPSDCAPPSQSAEPSRTDVVVAGHVGDSAIARAGLSAADAPTRAAALGALTRLDALAAHELLVAVSDPSPTVARRALELAAHLYEEHAAINDAVLTHATGADDDLAEMAVWALGERWQERADEPESTPVVDVLERLAADHADALVREAAVAALGAVGAERSVPVIIAATNDKATVRRRAVIALAPFEGPEVDAALNAAREDRDWQVRQAAEDLLAPPTTGRSE